MTHVQSSSSRPLQEADTCQLENILVKHILEMPNHHNILDIYMPFLQKSEGQDETTENSRKIPETSHKDQRRIK